MSHSFNLRSFKSSETFSEETLCFTAKLYEGDRHVGFVGNDGHGGSNYIHPVEGENYQVLLAKLKAAADELPPMVYDGREYEWSADSFVSELAEVELAKRKLARAMKGKVLFVKKDVEGLWAAGRGHRKGALSPAEVLERAKKIAAEPNTKAVLNLLPADEALALYRKVE